MTVPNSTSGSLFLSFAICFAFGTGLIAAVYFDERHVQDYDSATVRLTHSVSNHRRRRATTDDMPTEIHATVTSKQTNVKLRLKRNILASFDIPLFTLNKGNFIQQQMDDLLDFTNSGFYQDWNTGASLLVTKVARHLQEFDMEGPLIINGSEFLLTPSHELLPMNVSGGRAHHLKRLLTTINFGHDVRDERTPVEKRFRAQQAEARKMHRLREPLDGSRLSRRQAPVTHTIELTIVADYEIYERFLQFTERKKEAALSELKLYYIFLTNLMDIRYASVTTLDPSLIIRIALVSLVVTDVRREAVWTERNKLSQGSVNAERALYSFRDWIRVNTNIPRADHWMLFSGYDLAESTGTTATIGIAFIGTLCSDSAVSLVEEYFTATSGAVSAHELGHSIDADHDAMYRDCSDADNHVMSTIATFPREESRASHPWEFSSCSVDAFGAYLDTAQCARRPPIKSMSTSEVGGLYLDADEQCELAMGPGSYFCRTVQSRMGYDLTCRRMYCYLPDDPGYCSSIVPQEYTSCNNRKWCERGKCVENSNAPATLYNCPQGDDKQYNCLTADCSNSKISEAYCCRTCAELRRVTVSGNLDSVPSVTLNPYLFSSQPSSKPRTTRRTTPTLAYTSPAIPRSTMTPPCRDLECQCLRQWSIFCYFLYQG